MGKRILPPFAVSLLSGIFVFYSSSLFLRAIGTVVFLVAVFFFYFLIIHSFFSKQKVLICVLICILLYGFGGVHTHFLVLQKAQVDAFCCEHEKFLYSGKIYKKEIKNEKPVYYLSYAALKGAEGKVCKVDRMMIYMETDEYAIGTVLIGSGQLLQMHCAQNEGGFDEEGYLFSQRIFVKAFNQTVTKAVLPRLLLSEFLYQLRLGMKARYEAFLYQEEAGLLSTMALGERSELSAEVKDLFSDAGLSHILAISGLHIALVGMALFRLLRSFRFPQVPCAFFAGTIVIGYGVMTGGAIPAIRAVGMFLCMLLAKVLGEIYDIISAMSLMAILILSVNPLALFGVSFVFSFGAVLGVVLVGERLSKFYLLICRIRWERTHKRTEGRHYRMRFHQRLKSAMLAAFGIQLATIPIIAYNFYAVPVYVMFLNILLLPLMGTLLSFALLGGMGVPGAKLILYFCHILLFYYEAAADVSLRIPFSRWIVGKPSCWQMVLYYLILCFFLILLDAYQNRLIHEHEKFLARGPLFPKEKAGACAMPTQWRWLSGLFAVSAWLILLIGFHGKRDFEMVMLSVGQGDGIYMESGCGEHFFIDGGSTSEEELGKYTLQPFLFARGIGHIDRWFVTHMDLDHYSGLLWMIEHNYCVESVVFAKSVEKIDAFYDLVALCKTKKIRVEYMQTGDRIVCAKGSDREMALTCLGPDAPSGFDGTNENSLVLLLEKEEPGMGSFGCVLTGDVGAEQEQAILEKEIFGELLGNREKEKEAGDVRGNVGREEGLFSGRDVLLLKAAHHGSNNSNCADWLLALSPDLCIISAGKNNMYHHPGSEAIARMDAAGIAHLCTIDCGQITVRWKDGRMEVERYLKE